MQCRGLQLIHFVLNNLMMQKFILPQLNTAPATARIAGQDARHIFKVLRLAPGDIVSLTNGKGMDFKAKITNCTVDKIDLDVVGSSSSTTESPMDIILCCGMLKDKKMDLVIKHVTQLGITRWLPFYCQRSIPKHNENRLASRIKRWQSIAGESVKQCRRSRVPKIASPLPFSKMLESVQTIDLKIAFWENATKSLADPAGASHPDSIALLIGPEGGFTKEEIFLAQSKGFEALSLGPRILRAETAAISGCTLLQHFFGDLK